MPALPAWMQQAIQHSGTRSWAPPGYSCPFCALAAGDCSHPENRCELSDLIYQDDTVMAFVACDGFGPRPGHVMITPTAHYETLYTLPAPVLAAIGELAQEIAWALKLALNPDGVSTRQHNEPAGNQHVWHYHLHVFPRYSQDSLYTQHRQGLDKAVRAELANTVKAALAQVREWKNA